jgi:hypothetical protein
VHFYETLEPRRKKIKTSSQEGSAARIPGDLHRLKSRLEFCVKAGKHLGLVFRRGVVSLSRDDFLVIAEDLLKEPDFYQVKESCLAESSKDEV